MTAVHKLRLIYRINKLSAKIHTKKKKIIEDYIDNLHKYHRLLRKLDDIQERLEKL